MGLVVAMGIREMCEGLDAAGDDDSDSQCGGVVVTLLKALTTVLTGWHVYLMWLQLDTRSELLETRQMLLDRSRGRQLSLTVANATATLSNSKTSRLLRKLRGNLVTVCVWIPLNLIHPVPMISRLISTAQLGLRPVYRLEALIAAFMVLRVIHVYVLFKWKLVILYLNLDASLLIRNEGAVHLLNDSGMSQATLALKISLMRNPGLIIMLAWLVLICTCAVVIRVSESTAGVDSSPYVWDQLWLVITTATTTGYGDLVPQTHFGRFGSVVCMVSGPVLVSVMTATLSRSMTLSRREELVMKTLDEDALRADLQDSACRMLQIWWRSYSYHKHAGARRHRKKVPVQTDDAYTKLVCSMFDTKRLLQRHLLSHADTSHSAFAHDHTRRRMHASTLEDGRGGGVGGGCC